MNQSTQINFLSVTIHTDHSNIQHVIVSDRGGANRQLPRVSPANHRSRHGPVSVPCKHSTQCPGYSTWICRQRFWYVWISYDSTFHAFLLIEKYTERQKKLITSSEWHSLKSTASEWIVFAHRLGKFSLIYYLSKKTKFYFKQRGDKFDEIARGQFSKITETACLSGWEFEADKSQYGVYVTRHWNWMNL